MNLNKIKHIHFTGIKGVGMTSLALCALDLGIKVTGSDIEELFVTDEVLKKRKVKWSVGFSKDNIGKSDLVITTGAHGGLKNPEVLYAKEKNIPVITQAEGLKLFSQKKDVIGICGVGGKTTISSMVASVLDGVGLSPSYAIGAGEIFPLGDPGKFQKKGKHFVCEADEYVVSPGIDNTPKFLLLDPKIIVVTNIEHDHPDVYKSFSDTKKAYLKFFKKLDSNGILIVFADNKKTLGVAKESGVNMVTYGRSEDVDWRIESEERKGLNTKVVIENKNEKTTLNLKFPGEYNIENALAALIASIYAGVSKDDAVKEAQEFLGVKRRFEKVGKLESGAILYDDYAHHPEEITSVLKLAKDYFPKRRIICVFQPHTYTRTKVLFNEFGNSFSDADIALFTDIYSSAREKVDKSVDLRVMAKKAKGKYVGNLEKATNWLKRNTNKNDLVLTLGAGDIFYIHKKLVKK